ncbi:MAG: hypothetical protein AAB867_03335, partial [Patescibacteria group bacterium]
RFPVSGTAAATTFLDASTVLGFTAQITDLDHTSNAVVVEGNNGAGSYGIVSAPKNGAAAFYHAGGRIFGPSANTPGPYVVEAHRAPRSAEPFAAYVKPAAQGEPLRVRKITIK